MARFQFDDFRTGLLRLAAFGALGAIGFQPIDAGEASPSQAAAVRVNSGPLVFEERVLAENYTYAYGLAVADLDGDGHLDLTSSDAEENSNVYLFRGNGKGGFEFSFIQKYAGKPDQPVRLERHAIGDINRDKLPDVVIVDNMKNDIRWFENPGKDAIGKPWKLHRLTASNEVPGCYDVALADFDGDGDLDAASSCYYGSRFDWFENIGSPGAGTEWKRHELEADIGETRTIAVGDFNNDGKPDLLGSARTGNQVVWYQNPARPAAEAWPKTAIDSKTVAPMHGHPVDLDRDGDLDVIMSFGHAAPVDSDSHQITWYENVGRPGDGTAWKKRVVNNEFPNAIEVVAGDLDGDDDLDLVATSWSGYGQIAWFENTGDPKADWKMHPIKQNWCNAITVVLADFDRDGRLDIAACAERGANEVRFWRNLSKPKRK